MFSTALTRVGRSAFTRPLRNLLRPALSLWPRPVPARLQSGAVCYVDLRGAIGRGVLVTGCFDPALTSFLRSELEVRRGAFIDAGAHIGYFSVVALEMNVREVHAFEVDPRPLRCLRLTSARNSSENLMVHECALGDRDGFVRLALQPESWHTYVDLKQLEGPSFPIKRLDSFRDSLRSTAGLIKIDVEGAELAVLLGAEGILREHRPMVVCEVIPKNLARFGHTDSDLIAWMGALGYSFRELPGANDPTLIFSAS
jgi:FkbM family methyltransferase